MKDINRLNNLVDRLVKALEKYKDYDLREINEMLEEAKHENYK